MNYLKLFEYYSNKTEEQQEEIEDALMIEGIFDEWTLLEKDYEPGGATTDAVLGMRGMRYDFKLEPKKNKYLHHRDHELSNSYHLTKSGFKHCRFTNEDFFDNQTNELFNKLSHSRLNKLGYKFKVNWTYDHDGYFDNGDSKYKVDIWISVTENVI